MWLLCHVNASPMLAQTGQARECLLQSSAIRELAVLSIKPEALQPHGYAEQSCPSQLPC